MSATIVYRWDDGGAPVLAGVRTSLVDLLTACLVDGYGEKAGAGWTRPFVNVEGTRAAFRNNPATSTGSYLQINQATSSAANKYYCRGYEGMASDADGVLPFGYSSEIQLISANVSTTPRPWVLVANDRWFYFFGYNGETVMPTAASIETKSQSAAAPTIAFGDFDPIYPDDGFACMCMVTAMFTSPTYFGMVLPASTGYQGGQYVNRRVDGTAGGTQVALHIPAPGGSSGSTGIGTLGAPYTGLSGLLTSRVLISDGAANTARGFLPGVLAPLHPKPFEHLSTQVFDDGHTYIAISYKVSTNSGSGYCGQLLIDLGIA